MHTHGAFSMPKNTHRAFGTFIVRCKLQAS
nr:MAG TPA: hypothetical protein [Caudoviricetes sp.]